MKLKKEIFKEYDIRGIVNNDLNHEVAYFIGIAYGTLLRKINPDAEKISVGKDVRHSSNELFKGITEGVISTGIDVIDIGVCPTPVQYFSIYHLNTDGGIMVTGSHNPPEYNGFKLSIGKDTIFGNKIQQIKEIIENKQWITSNKKGSIKEYDILKAYKEYMLGQFSYLSNLNKYKKIKVVVDAGNGTAGIVVPELLKEIGCEVIPLFCEPDGNFPNHHPDPTVIEYIQELIKVTKKIGADIGVGYDGDADRIGIVDKDGEIVWGDYLMIILSRELLKKNKGAKIVGDVKCSQIMFDDIKKHGGIPIMWKTGHSLIKNKMKEEKALLAGEFSGHIFIRDRYFGFDDAIYTTLRLVEIMKKNNIDIKGLLSDLPKKFSTPEIRIECKEDIKKKVVERVVDMLSKADTLYNIKEVNTIDGIRVKFDKGWGLVRMSNTQPVVVVRVEAEKEDILKDYKEFIEQKVKSSIEYYK